MQRCHNPTFWTSLKLVEGGNGDACWRCQDSDAAVAGESACFFFDLHVAMKSGSDDNRIGSIFPDRCEIIDE